MKLVSSLLLMYWLINQGQFQFGLCSLTYEIKSKRAIVGSAIENGNLHGLIEKGYYIEVLMGTPPQRLNILIDTGSSNFAVASFNSSLTRRYYDSEKSSSVINSGIPDVDIEYTEGFWKGPLVTDLVSIPEAGLTEQVRVDIVKITSSKKFFINGSGWQGIIGLGYDELVRPNNPKVKSFMTSVIENTSVRNVFSIQLCAANTMNFSDVTTGSLVFGDYDRTDGTIFRTRIVHEWYYEVIVLGMKVGNVTVNVPCREFNNDKSIVDSGTTNLHLPEKVFNSVIDLMKKITAKTIEDFVIDDAFWDGLTVLCWDPDFNPYLFFPNLTVYLPSVEINNTISLMLSSYHYILYNKNLTNEDADNTRCFKFGISSSQTGTVLGAVLMEQYVVVFDRENRTVGFTRSNCSEYSELEHYGGYINSTACTYDANTGLSSLQIATYVILGLLGLCAMPACILFYIWCYKSSREASENDRSELLDNATH